MEYRPLQCGAAAVSFVRVWAQAGEQPQLRIDVDSGSYCVQVFDQGHLTDRANFSLTYVHP